MNVLRQTDLRYAAVVTPLKFHWYASTSGIFVCVIVIWIVSFFFNLPYYFVYDYCREVCGVQMSVSKFPTSSK